MYSFIRNILFNFPPEEVHYFSMNCLKAANNIAIINKILAANFQPNNHLLQKNIFGLQFSNPIGLGAGFDKNALYLKELNTLGFGFAEIGTVTPLPQNGNDKPRLFRLPKDKALINRMGFNNHGVQAIKKRLYNWQNIKAKQNLHLIVGGNIGKNKITPNEDAWKDYEICFKELLEVADYFVVNVSSPNTPGLRALQEKDALYKILSHLQNINIGSNTPKPLLLKIAPDLTTEQLNDIIALTQQVRLSGLVATNTTISRDNLLTPTTTINKIGAGGLSGKPVTAKSTTIVNYLHQNLPAQFPIIASGGIFTAADAQEKLNAGASLLQVWTGFVYEGPSIVKNICKGL